MWFPTLTSLWRSRSQPRPIRRKPARARLAVERLEDRTVPSNFTAASVSDLIADINAANLTAEADTITLVAGKTFTLTEVNNTTDGPTGLPVIGANENLTIIGNGDTIERSTAAGTPAFRLFDVVLGATLTANNLTLQGGLAFGAGVAAKGGAVYNHGATILDGVTVQKNTAQGADGRPGSDAAGGGLYSNGSMTIEGCTIQNNAAIGGRGLDGIGLYGLAIPGGAGGSALGGGIYVDGGMIMISSTTLTGNTAQGGNGGNGISVGTNNSRGGDGGSGFGGGLYAAGGAVTLHNSSVTKNVANGGAGGHGAKGQPKGVTGQGVGGGIYIGAAASVGLDAFTVAQAKQNHASTSDNDIFGSYNVIP